MKAFRIASFFAAMAVFCCLTAFVFMAAWSEPTIPTCGGKPMTRGDLCGHSRGGGSITSRDDYDSQLEIDQTDRLFWVWGISAVFTLVATVAASVLTPVPRTWLGEGSNNANS